MSAVPVSPSPELRFTPRPRVGDYTISSAVDELGLYYVILRHVNGRRTHASVIDPVRGLVYKQDWVGYLIHIDEVRKHLQRVASSPDTVLALVTEFGPHEPAGLGGP